MRCARHDHRAGGFTLLELILASAMVAVLGMTLFASMSIGYRARDRAHAQVRDARELSIVMDLVVQDLQSVQPPQASTTIDTAAVDPQLAGAFVGFSMGSADARTDSVQFSSLGRDRWAEGTVFEEGARQVELRLRADLTPPALVRRVRHNLLAPSAPEPVEEVLATGVRSFAVRYFDGLSWHDEWDSRLQENAMPVALGITIALDAPSRTDATRPYQMTQVVPLVTGQALTLEGLFGG